MMAIKKARKEGVASKRLKRLREKEAEAKPSRVSSERLTAFTVFASFTLLLIIVCFVGLSPAGPQVIQDQVARTRVVAEFPFSYVSGIQTEEAESELRQRIPPVYRLAQEPYNEFRAYIFELHKALSSYLQSSGVDATAATERQSGKILVSSNTIERFLHDEGRKNPYQINPEDLAVLANTLPNDRREQVLAAALGVLEDLYQEGIYDRDHSQIQVSTGQLSFFNIEQQGGQISEVQVLSEEEALRYLRINLTTLDIPREASVALFRIMRAGLKPNLVFDRQRTEQVIEEAIAQLEPRRVNVREGETIIEPNTRVTAQQFEQLSAYREELRLRENDLGINSAFAERSLLAIAAAIISLLFLKIQRSDVERFTRLLILAGLVIFFNLIIIRLLLTLSESEVVQFAPTMPLILPWLAPLALGPMVIGILLGGASGAVAAGFVAVFVCLMQGGSLAILMMGVLVSLTAVHLCRGIQVRARVVRAGALSGLVMAACAFFLGLRDHPDNMSIILMQMGAAILNGAITGTAVVGLLPILENLFRHTTDITLLELTDYNHPLLRRLQVSAPGSYHHSLMVANLAENAAAAIGANPLLCRVAALYHDIGKMVKPEYFSENQREGGNPHVERNPSMSALIIKAHVKEGVVLARQYRLPRVIIDVIREHHGTSLIQYFYYKALQRQQDLNVGVVAGTSTKVELDEVSESTYRYDGPRPQSIESAIIMLADSLEAASRSLKKVTPQSIEDFADRIIQDRIDDGQLDDVDITLRQVAKVRESFIFTLLNMLHTRVEYPKAGDGRRQSREAAPQEAPAEKPAPVAPVDAGSEQTKPDSDSSRSDMDTAQKHA